MKKLLSVALFFMCETSARAESFSAVPPFQDMVIIGTTYRMATAQFAELSDGSCGVVVRVESYTGPRFVHTQAVAAHFRGVDFECHGDALFAVTGEGRRLVARHHPLASPSWQLVDGV